MGLRYANGPNPFTGTKTIGVSVNGGQPQQTSLPSTGAWNRWSTRTERLDLRKGRNTITYTYRPEDTGHVNLDMIEVRRPGSRIDLFSGGSVSTGWQHTDGRSVEWPHTAEDSIEVCCGDIRTKQAFGDFRLHAEFRVPKLPDDVTGQDRGNSGIYLQERYELQILDSFGVEKLAANEAASIYNKKAADLNAATAPETWQTYDIVFRAARFDAAGKKTDDARITVVWNGKKVHDNVAVDGPTGAGDAESAAAACDPAPGPWQQGPLQEHLDRTARLTAGRRQGPGPDLAGHRQGLRRTGRSSGATGHWAAPTSGRRQLPARFGVVLTSGAAALERAPLPSSGVGVLDADPG